MKLISANFISVENWNQCSKLNCEASSDTENKKDNRNYHKKRQQQVLFCDIYKRDATYRKQNSETRPLPIFLSAVQLWLPTLYMQHFHCQKSDQVRCLGKDLCFVSGDSFAASKVLSNGCRCLQMLLQSCAEVADCLPHVAARTTNFIHHTTS